MINLIKSIILLILISSCHTDHHSKLEKSNLKSGFSLIESSISNVTFNNKFQGEKYKSPFDYINVFNGGGVGLGDINGDDKLDIFFCGSLVSNKIYVNKGNWVFEDISVSSGIANDNIWTNGIVFHDINNDGLEDIYLSNAYHEDRRRRNQLYINNGDLTFTESAKLYGIDDQGYSIQSGFFDFDNDGDNDLYVANHPRYRSGKENSGEHYSSWLNPTLEYSDKLYRNEGNGKFVDVTESSGILNYGWSLSFITSDFNDDGWMDIYVAVDHDQPDILYINQQNGTFKDSIGSYFDHLSFSSMGSDIADVDNDGLTDLFVADMMSNNNYHEKTQMASMNPDLFKRRVSIGYQRQFMRNMLHLNRGNSTYSEIAQYSGISRSDWTWATLFFDFDYDNKTDLFISNGIYKNILDKDFRSKNSTAIYNAIHNQDRNEQPIVNILEETKSTPLANYFFKQTAHVRFENYSDSLGMTIPSFSSGAAYGDLDNDGDLDLVINNIHHEAFLYRNDVLHNNNHIALRLLGAHGLDPIGAHIYLWKNGKIIKSAEYLRTRGYASCMSRDVFFGIGKLNSIDSLEVIWPGNQSQIMINPNINQRIQIKFNPIPRIKSNPIEGSILNKHDSVLFTHQENNFDDYKIQVLLPHMMSRLGPILSKGDTNNDTLEDFFVGGASGQAGALHIQNSNGTFSKTTQPDLEQDSKYEDMGSVFGDYDNDGDNDLIITSGGYEHKEGHGFYQDRYYENNDGVFKRMYQNLPSIRSSSGRIIQADVDNDNDTDLLILGRQVPQAYPAPASSRLLINDGKGKFTDKTNELFSDLLNIGMVTDAVWVDLNDDQLLDLILIGEWMTIRIFIKDQGGYTDKTKQYISQDLTGWWNRIQPCDIDQDGDLDFVVGNLGLNYKYKASLQKPFEVFSGDLDKNGTRDIILGYYFGGQTLYPVRGFQCSSEQMPILKEKFDLYHDFASSSLHQIYGDELDNTLHYKATEFRSGMLENKDGQLIFHPFTGECQMFPIMSLAITDINNDGHEDIILAGNIYDAEVETGGVDAGKGQILLGNGTFQPIVLKSQESKFYCSGNVKDILSISNVKGGAIIVARNDDILTVYDY